jgi:hypothetical protein
VESARKKVSSATLILVLICFFMPFVTFSCGGQKLVTLSGMQLVTGTTIEEPQMFGPPKKTKLAPECMALLTFLAVIAGLGFELSERQEGHREFGGFGCARSHFSGSDEIKLRKDRVTEGSRID